MPARDFRVRIVMAELIEVLQAFLFSTVAAVVLFRLGNMQFSGLVTFAGVAIGLLFAFTSLQYNRARAYRSGPIQRRTLMAAEATLRATFAFTFGAILTATIYLLLENHYPPTPLGHSPPMAAPAFFAFVPLMFFTYTIAMLSKATRILLHGMRATVTLRSLSKNA